MADGITGFVMVAALGPVRQDPCSRREADDTRHHNTWHAETWCVGDYSCRNATIGSTLAARRAGT